MNPFKYRIAIIVDAFPSRTETFICRHIQSLRADVVAVSMDHTDIKGWNWKPHVSCLLHKNRKKEMVLQRIVRRSKEVMLGIPPPRWPIGMEKVWDKYVDSRLPDVALAEFGPNGICALEGCQRNNIPFVVHFHGYDASSMLRIKSYRNCLPNLFKKSAAVVVVSRVMRKTLRDMGCPPSKLHVIPCGAPTKEFTLSDNVSKQPCHFITVASFSPGKGSLFSLKAFKQCNSQWPETKLIMIGDGKEFGKATRFVKKNNLNTKVNLLGFQSVKDVRENLSRCSVFLQHSVKTQIGCVEGWGVSMAEAASKGLPVIATNHGGIPDHVVDGKTGYLVEEKNYVEMGEKMVLLAKNPILRCELGLAGRKNIELVGNFELQIEKLHNLLSTVANKR